MLLGPVFASELRATSRRFRYYAARSGLSALLLTMIWIGYHSLPSDDLVSVHQMSNVARTIFVTLVLAQGLTVVAITPALVAPTIAGERSRKTLDDLMATDLSSAEIVVGKLGARLLIVLVLLSASLPILSLQTLLGGIAPWEVAGSYAVTASIAVFVGGLSIIASTLARGPREAVFAAYVITAPFLLMVAALWVIAHGGPTAPGMDWDSVAQLVAVLTGSGVASAALASILLRPSLGWRRERHGTVSLSPRRTLGDDPMRWKETQVRRRAGFVGLGSRLILGCLFVGLAYLTVLAGADSFRETWRYGYLARGNWWAHSRFNEYLKGMGTALYLLALVAVTAMAAISVTSEREADTWTGLIATPLTPEEILKAKRVGVYRRTWPLILATPALWSVGLLCGAIHPLGFFAAIVLLPAYFSAAVALGVFVSLHAGSTARSVAIALAITIFLHGGYLLLCVPMSIDTPVAIFGCSPLLVALAPLSPGDVREFTTIHGHGSFYTRGGEIAFAAVLSVLVYSALAIGLNIISATGFDDAVDRPRRPRAST
jgi:hypothetical protein